MLKTENRMFYFLMRLCKHDVISDGFFPHLRGRTPFSCLTWIFKFYMQTAFQINLLPFPIAYIRRYTEMDLHQKCSIFPPIWPLQYAYKKRFDCEFYDTFWMTHFKFTRHLSGVRAYGFEIKETTVCTEPYIVLTLVLNMHTEGNRLTFLHVYNFKTFVNELYFVRMYEDQT